MKSYRTLEEFEEECWLFSAQVLNFVESISGENRWWFNICYYDPYSHPTSYQVLFTSYDTPEYAKFILNIGVTRTETGYECRLIKQITDLS